MWKLAAGWLVLLPFTMVTSCADEESGAGDVAATCDGICLNAKNLCDGQISSTAEYEGPCRLSCEDSEIAAASASCKDSFELVMECCSDITKPSAIGCCEQPIDCVNDGLNITCGDECGAQLSALQSCINGGSGGSGAAAGNGGSAGSGGAGGNVGPADCDTDEEALCNEDFGCVYFVNGPYYLCNTPPPATEHHCFCSSNLRDCCDPSRSDPCVNPSWPDCNSNDEQVCFKCQKPAN